MRKALLFILVIISLLLVPGLIIAKDLAAGDLNIKESKIEELTWEAELYYHHLKIRYIRNEISVELRMGLFKISYYNELDLIENGFDGQWLLEDRRTGEEQLLRLNPDSLIISVKPYFLLVREANNLYFIPVKKGRIKDTEKQLLHQYDEDFIERLKERFYSDTQENTKL